MKQIDTNAEPSTSGAEQPRRNRKKIVIISAALILVVAVVATVVIKHFNQAGPVSVSKQLSKAPVMVGSYHYVNACQLIPVSSYKSVYNYEITNDASIKSTFAEGSHSKLPITTSFCSVDIGNIKQDNGGDQPDNSSIATAFLTLQQYHDTESAAKTVEGLEDQKGQTITVDPNILGNSGAPTTSIEAANIEVIQVGDTKVYNDRDHIGRFEFVHRNINVFYDMSDEISGAVDGGSVVTTDYVKQLINKLVPVANKSIDSTTLSQSSIEPKNLGQRIDGGTSAKNILACDYFTGDDFKAIMGVDEDNSQIQTNYSTDPMAYAKTFEAGKEAKNGRGYVDCTRFGYINTDYPDVFKDSDAAAAKANIDKQIAYDKIKQPVVVETIDYYKDNAEAIAGAKFKQSAKKQNYPDTVNSEVSGLSDYAGFSKFTAVTDPTNPNNDPNEPQQYELYVAKGSYVATISIYYRSNDQNQAGLGSDTQYKKAAQLLIDRLPD